MKNQKIILKKLKKIIKKKKPISKINAMKNYMHVSFQASVRQASKNIISVFEVDFVISSTVFEIRLKQSTLHS